MEAMSSRTLPTTTCRPEISSSRQVVVSGLDKDNYLASLKVFTFGCKLQFDIHNMCYTLRKAQWMARKMMIRGHFLRVVCCVKLCCGVLHYDVLCGRMKIRGHFYTRAAELSAKRG